MAFNFERYLPGDWWSESVIDDAKAIGALMGWQIERVYFSGFWSQGDGACFEGGLGYAKQCAKAVRAYAPQDSELHAIADRWQALQKRCFYSLWGSVAHSGHYHHEFSTRFTWEDSRDSWRALPADCDDDATEIARDYMRWIYRALEREYNFHAADCMARGWQEQRDEMAESRGAARQLVADIRAAMKSGLSAAPSICSALRGQLRALLDQWEAARDERDSIADNFHYWHDGKSLSVAEFAALYV